jgi:hydrogenase maturation protease
MPIKPFLILGIGNLLRTDDGVGVHVVNQLNDSGELPGWVEAIDAGTSGLDLPAMMQGRERVIVVDALEASEEPGSIFRFDARRLASSAPHAVSLHEAGIVEALRALDVLGERPEAEIIGIVPQDAVTMGMVPTRVVLAAVPKVMKLALQAVSEYQKLKAEVATGEDIQQQ